MREIVFKDETLLKEMLNEWIEDSENKLIEMKIRSDENNWSGLFNKIHELKTNFSMIHCYQGIQLCEKYIGLMETENNLMKPDLLDLENLVKLAIVQIRKTIT